MANAAEDVSVLEAELTCPVCLDIYREPHLLPCGHNFCLSCLRKLKNQEERGRLRCPECRQNHSSSKPLQKNFKLASIADGLRHRGRVLQPGPRQELPGVFQKCSKVHCDYCPSEDSTKAGEAVKTCLKCEVSMCLEHLRPHLDLPAFRGHPLVEPLSDLKKRKCSEHDEMFRYYCTDEQMFLCNACTIEGEHCGHALKTLKNTTKDLKTLLDTQMQKVDRKMTRAEKNLLELREVEDQSKAFTEETNQRMEALQATLRNSLDGFFASLSECVRSDKQQHNHNIQQDLTRVKEDQKRLSAVQAGIKQLLHESDPFIFIKEYNSCHKRYNRHLRMPLFVASSVEQDPDALAEDLEEKLDEFVSDLRQNVTTFITSLCAGRESECVQENEEDAEEMEDDDEEDCEEEEEEEMQSEDEEQDWVDSEEEYTLDE